MIAVDSLANEAKDNPILTTYFNEARLDMFRQHLAEAMNISYEDVSDVVDEEFIIKFL